MTAAPQPPTQKELTDTQKVQVLSQALRELYPYVLRYDQPGERWPRLCIEQTLQQVGEPLEVPNAG